jgi:Domain of unknown function (DUF4288)
VGAKSKKAWYGVRTLYRLAAKGKPKSRDRHFDPESTLVEDRIVIFQAISFDDAIAQAIKEARFYSRQTRFVNMYGQKVRMQFLDAFDAFKIFDRKPAAGSEVYSSTELVRAAVSDSAVIKRRMGPLATGATEVRYKFIDGRILRKALATVALDNNSLKH